MKRTLLSGLLALTLGACNAAYEPSVTTAGTGASEDGWISLFDGQTLDGWKWSAHGEKSFRVEDGAIVAQGQPFSHLFYDGEVNGGMFKSFEFKAEVMTRPNSNGGIYFHTRFQRTGWPQVGLEVQVNNTYAKDPTKTGSLYNIQNLTEAPAPDNEWFTEHVIVRGNHAVVKINDKTVVDWTQPDDWNGVTASDSDGNPITHLHQRLAGGTFAFQAHDPNSTVLYRNIRVKPLP